MRLKWKPDGEELWKSEVVCMDNSKGIVLKNHKDTNVHNLLHNGLSSGQSLQFPVMFSHFVLTANGKIKHLMNNLSNTKHSSHREIVVRGPLFLWHTFCLLMQKMQSGLLACWWLSSSSPANASHLLPTVIIPFNSMATLQTHCGLTDRKRQACTCAHPCAVRL